ncbi:hypothetical protein WJ437_01305 [Ignavigranum ruoffiae]|uniref:hypothetical protein n=1 Tax=Ignavigranum ruoffiae TaxID=89093 RepID=UPI003B000756
MKKIKFVLTRSKVLPSSTSNIIDIKKTIAVKLTKKVANGFIDLTISILSFAIINLLIYKITKEKRIDKKNHPINNINKFSSDVSIKKDWRIL